MYPWSIRGPFRVTDEHGNEHYEMRIGELPDFFVAGSTDSEVLYEFKPALLAFLESYTSEGEIPPLPSGDPATFVALKIRTRLPKLRLPVSDATASSAREPVALV
jgi:predicted RNase H-like HicB family nuclease